MRAQGSIAMMSANPTPGRAMSAMMRRYLPHANMARLNEPVAPQMASGIISVMHSTASAVLRAVTWQ